MPGLVSEVARGSLSRVVEAIYVLFALLIERWRHGEPLAVSSAEIQGEFRTRGIPEPDEDLCYAVAQRWSDLANTTPVVPERDLIFSRVWKRLLPEECHEQDVRYYFMRSL